MPGPAWTVLVGLLLLSGCGGSDPSPEATPPIIEPPPDATTRTWTFHGTTANGSLVDGTFAYEKDALLEPTDLNLYAPLSDWNMHVRLSALDLTISPDLPPVLFFSSGIPGSPDVGFAEWSDLCFNHCESNPYVREMARLVFHNDLHELRLVFVSPVRHTQLPVEIGDWGVFAPNDSRLDLWSDAGDIFQYRVQMRDGELVE